MSAEQEKLLRDKIFQIPEIKFEIDMEVFVDFVIIYAQEENIEWEIVLDKFIALRKEDKDAILEKIKSKIASFNHNDDHFAKTDSMLYQIVNLDSNQNIDPMGWGSKARAIFDSDGKLKEV